MTTFRQWFPGVYFHSGQVYACTGLFDWVVYEYGIEITVWRFVVAIPRPNSRP